MRLAAIFGILLLLQTEAGFAREIGQLLRGEPVVNPEALSGVWLAPDGRGGWVEIRLEIAAMLPLGGSLADGPFLLAHVSLGLCHGHRSPMQFGECNYFSDDSDGGLLFGQKFLRVHLPAWGDSPREDVELSREGEAWAGTWRRGNWFGRMRLERTGMGGLSGTWRSVSGHECLHLSDDVDGLVGSLDQLQDPQWMRYANGLRPQPLYESFGRIVGAENDRTGVLSFEVGGGAAMVRTIHVRPRMCIVQGRRQVVLTGMRSGDGRYAEPDWVRVRGESCRGR